MDQERFSTRTLKDLFLNYQHENDRINQKEANLTKQLIMNEIKKRTYKAYKELEQCKTKEEALQTYKQFIEK